MSSKEEEFLVDLLKKELDNFSKWDWNKCFSNNVTLSGVKNAYDYIRSPVIDCYIKKEILDYLLECQKDINDFWNYGLAFISYSESKDYYYKVLLYLNKMINIKSKYLSIDSLKRIRKLIKNIISKTCDPKSFDYSKLKYLINSEPFTESEEIFMECALNYYSITNNKIRDYLTDKELNDKTIFIDYMNLLKEEFTKKQNKII